MQIKYCDICHAVLPTDRVVYALARMAIYPGDVGFGEVTKLCDKCSDQFDDWVDGRLEFKDEN